MGGFKLISFFLCVFLFVMNHTSLTTAKMDSKNGDILGNVPNLSPPPFPPPPMARSRITPFKPSIAIVVGILTTIFSIISLFLLYMKHCKRNTYSSNSRGYGYPLSRGNSGINRKVIESLPMFRFSSLKGQKDGLECAVCLNKFEGNEVLRLLPKCKHAFHVECVDTWLDAHSTCPLCRYRVDAEDVLLVDYHGDQFTPRNSDQGRGNEFSNPRISGRHSSAGERGRNSHSLEIIAENRRHDSRGRISLDGWKSSRRKEKEGTMSENTRALRKDGQLPVQGDKRRLEHRIIVSATEEEERRRWSDVEAAAFLYLRSEMIMGRRREEAGSGRGVINERSVSEITGMSRYSSNNGGKEGRERQEERVVKRWLDWISQSQEQQKTAVNSVELSSSSSSSAIADV
ncbi:hypothetical protein CDL12_18819 [Handroanthus impetiginosus]|uniref:RING-type E3 ubiquitin transferase n=1 Tax=Handroanthus impetiginosus TaxID=429701 RepID=A0A2G9GTJ5_9LAMI|nr:hypothetical protein CDL12_18819 [Handroanthus impetiginosus]